MGCLLSGGPDFTNRLALGFYCFQSAQSVGISGTCVQGDSGGQCAGDFAFGCTCFGCGGCMYANAAFATCGKQAIVSSETTPAPNRFFYPF